MESDSIQENLDSAHVWDGNNMMSFCISIGIPLECACSHWNSMGIRYPPNFAEETIESIDFRAEVGQGLPNDWLSDEIGHDWFAKWRNFTEHATNHWVNSGLVGWSVNMLGSCLVYYIIIYQICCLQPGRSPTTYLHKGSNSAPSLNISEQYIEWAFILTDLPDRLLEMRQPSTPELNVRVAAKLFDCQSLKRSNTKNDYPHATENDDGSVLVLTWDRLDPPRGVASRIPRFFSESTWVIRNIMGKIGQRPGRKAREFLLKADWYPWLVSQTPNVSRC